MTAATLTQADDLVPRHGDLSYGVRHYDLDLRYRSASNHLEGEAVLDVETLLPTDTLTLDLFGFSVSRVSATGAAVRSWAHRQGRIVVRLQRTAVVGTAIRLTVRYQGVPRLVPGADGACGWEELTDGVLVASQPYGAPSWFPCNDRPSDKATYRISVRAATPYTVVANGVLAGRRASGSATTWVFEQTQPMAPYLAAVHIGRYETTVLATRPGSVPMSVVHPTRVRAEVATTFARQPRMMEVFERLFGPYPFSTYTVVVADDVLEIPVEAQTLSAFGTNHLRLDWDAQRLVAHELSHSWFGNSVTASRWRDIWLHEGFACHAEWLWSEQSGGPSAREHARLHWRRLNRLPEDLVLASPDATTLFDDRVYKRGALFLQALRETYGDTAYFGLVRQWLAEHRYGSVTTEDFVSALTARLGPGSAALAEAWLLRPALPGLPADRTSS